MLHIIFEEFLLFFNNISLILYWGNSPKYNQTMSMLNPNCCTGSLDEGTPSGHVEKLDGIDCYVSAPPSSSAVSDKAVIICTDVFGWEIINCKLIADVFAKEGYYSVVPNYIVNPVPRHVLETFDQDTSNLGYTGAAWRYTSLFLSMMRYFPMFLWNNKAKNGADIIAKVAKCIRANKGIKKIAAIGYCWGGSTLIELAKSTSSKAVDVYCIVHPGKVTLADLALIDKDAALQWIFATDDHSCPEALRKQMEEELKKRPQTAYKTYEAHHGFASRGSKMVPTINTAREDVIEEQKKFFKDNM